MYLDVIPFVLGPAISEFKRCAKCSEYKTRDQFHKSRNRKDGLYNYCKSCACGDAHQYRKNNPEKKRGADRAYREANRDSIREYQTQYRNNNRESLRKWQRQNYADNREILQRRHKGYIANHPEVRRANWHKRRARKLSLPDTLSTADWRYALDYFGGCCAACGRQPGLWHTLAADHWIPLTSPDCPGTVAWNIVPLCHGNDGCNNQKFNNAAADWLIEKFGPRKGRAILRKIEAFLESRKPDAA